MMMKTAVLTFKGGIEYIKEKQVENALDRCNENFALSVSDYDELDYCLPYLAEAGVQNLVVLHENFNLYSFEKALREEYGRYFDNIEVVPELFPRSLREGHPTGNVKAGYYNDQMTQGDVTDVIASKELFYEIYAANAPVWGVESFKPHCTQFVNDEEQINIVPIEDKEDPGIDAAIDNNEAINELALVTNSEPSEIVSMINQGLFAEIVEKLKSANLNSQHYEHFRKIVLYHIMSNYNLKTNGPVMSEGNVQNRLGGTLAIEDQTGNSNGAEDASFQILERRGRRNRYNRIKEGDSTVIRRPLLIAEKVCDGTDQNWFSTGVWYFAIDENDTTINQFFQKYGNNVFVTDSSITNSSTVASGNYNYVIYETNVYPLSFGFDVLKDDGALGFVSRNVTVLNCDSLNNFSNVVQSFTSAQYQTFNSAVISGPSPEEKSQINDYLTRNGMDPLYETTLREGDLVPYNNGGLVPTSGNNSLSVVNNNNSNAIAVNNKGNNNALAVTGGNKGLAVYSGGNNNLPAVASQQQNNIKDDNDGGVDNKFNQTSKKGSLLSVVSLDPSKGIWSANAYKLNSLKKGVVFNQPNDVSFCRSYASLVRSLRQSNALVEGGTVSIVVPKHMNDALGNAKEVEQQYNVRLNIIEKEGEDFTSLKPKMAEAYKLGAQIIKTPKIGVDTHGITGEIEGSDRFKNDKREKKLKMWKNQQVMPFTSFLIKTLSDIKATIELGNDDVAATRRQSLADILFRTIGAYDDLSTASKNAQNGGAALIIDASKVLIDYFKKDEGTKTSSSDSYIMHKDWDNFAKCFLPDTFKDATYKDTNLIKAGGLYVES
jgi:hypothetical protein